jgi:hypothetical protein
MVKAGHRFPLFAIALILSPSPGAAVDPGDYRLNDTIEEDIVTPVPLIVIDEARTAAVRQREAERLPALWRFYPGVADEVERDFRSAFAATRSNFLDAVEAAFDHRTLTAPELASAGFQRMVPRFQIRNRLFPADTNLAALWAAGRSDQEVQDALAARLRQAMQPPLFDPAALPGDLNPGAAARLVPLAATSDVPTLALADLRGTNVPPGGLVPLERARSEFAAAFPPAENPVGDYLAPFLRPNCAVDAALTRQFRSARTRAAVAVNQYVAGQIIARRGDVVTPEIKAALAELKDKASIGQLQQSLRRTRLEAARANRLLVGGGILILLAGALTAWWLTRSREERQTLRATLLSLPARWRRPPRSAVRVKDLDTRVITIRNRMQDRLLIYERRILELEQELKTRAGAGREPLQKELDGLRRQLATERARSAADLSEIEGQKRSRREGGQPDGRGA